MCWGWGVGWGGEEGGEGDEAGFEGFGKKGLYCKKRRVGWESACPWEWFFRTFDVSYSARIEIRDSGEAAGPQVGCESNHYWIRLVITKA